MLTPSQQQWVGAMRSARRVGRAACGVFAHWWGPFLIGFHEPSCRVRARRGRAVSRRVRVRRQGRCVEIAGRSAQRAMRVSTLNVWGNRVDRDIPLAQLAEFVPPSSRGAVLNCTNLACARASSRARW
mgnify:CR=1 FL=1